MLDLSRRIQVGVLIVFALFTSACTIGNLAGTPIPLPYGGGPQITPGIPFIIMGGVDDADLLAIYQSSTPFPVPGTWTAVTGPQVLTGDFIQIGLNRGGAMVTPGSDIQPTPFLSPGVNPAPTNSVGFASRQLPTSPSEFDVMIPGCSCEGWSVKFDYGGSLYWGGADGNLGDPGLFNMGAGTTTLVSAETSSDGTNFAMRSVVDVGPLRVTLVIGLRRGDRYASFNITLTNTGTSPITNLRFARSLDFDIDASAGGSFSTDRWKVIQVGGVNAIVRGRGTTHNLRFYAIASRSPRLVVTDGQTFYGTDPDAFGNNDPNDGAGDFSSTFVFRIPTLNAGQSEQL
ncbi:MAG: hypothetical protein QN187_03615 [Armatimonadota bacterium]|nr:hypothetical protein [Armatimonadota bacterium]MDR7518976.1 hypothetical protein [Armatimonadota bacterium]MDR7548553.1 hypothetical protein [Armatimonadota bacterium]